MAYFASGTEIMEMGMRPWRAPQSSEHWPAYDPGRSKRSPSETARPGMASALTPTPGRARAWITSTAERRAVKASVARKELETAREINDPRATRLTAATSVPLSTQYHWRPTQSRREKGKDEPARKIS